MKLKVLQWNILYTDSTNRIDEIIKELKKFNADVYCLQEVSEYFNSDTIEKLLKAFPYGAYAYADEKRNENRVQGNAILSKYPIKEKKEVLIAPRYDYDNNIKREGRIYLECILNVNGKEIKIATLHHSLKKPNRPRDEEEKLTKELLKQNTKDFIFTADLNTTPEEDYFKELKNILTHCGPNENEKTCTTKPRIFADGTKEEYLSLRIDYVFSTPDMKVNTAKILNTEMSDHLPIEVEFEL